MVLGCYQTARYRKSVFTLGTLLFNSRKNGNAVLKIWAIIAAIYF